MVIYLYPVGGAIFQLEINMNLAAIDRGGMAPHKAQVDTDN